VLAADETPRGVRAGAARPSGGAEKAGEVAGEAETDLSLILKEEEMFGRKKTDEIQLGDVAKDSITGFEGVVTGRTEWLNGCCRWLIQPRSLHEGKPVEDVVAEAPCAVCGKKMILRQSRRGPFLGCSGYPECTNTLPCDENGTPLTKVEASRGTLILSRLGLVFCFEEYGSEKLLNGKKRLDF